MEDGRWKMEDGGKRPTSNGGEGGKQKLGKQKAEIRPAENKKKPTQRREDARTRRFFNRPPSSDFGAAIHLRYTTARRGRMDKDGHG